MPSKKLSFNATLFRKNLARFWPLWGGASLLGVLLPLALLMTLLNPYFVNDVTAADITRALYMVSAGALPIISLFYAVLTAMAVWSWLYTARSAGFMHTLPMNRETVFFTNVLSGLAMLLIPYAITGVLTCIVLLCFGIFPLLAVLQTISAVLGYTLFYFGTATFAAMITSNTIAMPVFYFIGHFFAVIIQTLLGWFASSLVFGYAGADDLSLTFLSPTVAFYRYMEINSTHLESGEWVITFHGLWIIWAYALAGLVLLVLSLLLYRLRHTESAGEVVAYRALKPIFRYGVALCSALSLGMLLYEIFWNNTVSARLYGSVVPMAAFMILAGVIGYYAASMLLSKSHKVFRGSGRGVATVTALVVLLCAGVYFDIPGLGRRIPDAAGVEGIYLQIGGESLSVTAGDPRIEEIIALQRCLMDSEDEIRAYDNRNAWRGGNYEENTAVYTLHIDYYLENGRTLTRQYRVPLFRSRWEREPDSYEGRIDRLVNSPQAAVDSVTGPKNSSLVHISIWAGSNSTDTDGPIKDTIYSALLEDARAGRCPGFVPFYNREEQVTYLDIQMDLEFRYTWTNENTGEQEVDYQYRSIQLTDSLTATLQALLDTGVLTADALPAEAAGPALPAIPDSGNPADPANAFDSAVVVTP